MEKFLRFLKTEKIGGWIIRYSLAGLLLFGGFAKLAIIGEVGQNLFGAIIMATIETLSAFGLIFHFRNPLYGIIAGLMAIIAIFIRFIFSLFWVRSEVLGLGSTWDAFQIILNVFNNGLFFIILLLGAAVYCTGNSYKVYIKERITRPWPH